MSVYRNVVFHGYSAYGDVVKADGETAPFSANLRTMLIYEALETFPLITFMELARIQDNVSEDVAMLDYDWTHYRDSSAVAIDKMYAKCRELMGKIPLPWVPALLIKAQPEDLIYHPQCFGAYSNRMWRAVNHRLTWDELLVTWPEGKLCPECKTAGVRKWER